MDGNKVANGAGKALAIILFGSVGAVVLVLTMWFCAFVLTHMP